MLSVYKVSDSWNCDVTIPKDVIGSSNPGSAQFHEFFSGGELPGGLESQDPLSHTHDFVTGVIYDATCDHDGLEGTYCKTCGYILNSSPISAFGYALYTDATQKITAAKSGQKIVLEFKELNSFPKAFMEKIAARVAEGVTFEFRYNVNHKLQKITIPAYSTVDTNLDWYGYAKMAELYGAN